MVKAKTGNTTDATVYNDWYKAVYMPSAAAEAAVQSVAKTTSTTTTSAKSDS